LVKQYRARAAAAFQARKSISKQSLWVKRAKLHAKDLAFWLKIGYDMHG
jgi:hypothetical protein